MKKILLFVLPALVAGFIGCSKDGATGPAGATGATGVTGPTGPSIILAADSFYAPSSSWIAVGSTFQYTYTDTKITQEILSKGTIDVALWYPSGPWWIALNDYYPGSGAGYRYFYKLNTLILEFDGSSTPPPSYSYKAVIIPGAVMQQNPKINWTDWKQVSAILASPVNK